MAQTVRKTPNYTAIGIFMAIGIFTILVSVIFADKLITKFRGGYPLYVTFDHIDGLVIGSKVVVGSGKNIGQVESIEIDGSQLKVTMLIDKKYKINNTATFSIYSTSFVGGKYLAVENFTGQAPFLNSGDNLSGINPITLNSLMSVFGDSFDPNSENGIFDGITSIVLSANNIVSTTESILIDNRNNIDTTLTNLALASIEINSISSNINRKLSMVSDAEFRQVLEDTKSSLNNLEQFLADINSSDAPLSLLTDPQIKSSITTIVTNLEETTRRVKAKPSLLLRS